MEPTKEADMELYAGIDLHSNNSVVSVLDEQDRTVYAKRPPNDLDAIVALLRACAGALRGAAVESTYNWYWMVDGLQAAGFTVHLVNTAAVKQYDGLKHGGDFSDARHLAHLLRLGILPVGYIYPREERAVRDLLRKRSQLVRQRSSLRAFARSRRRGPLNATYTAAANQTSRSSAGRPVSFALRVSS
jgi:transposase